MSLLKGMGLGVFLSSILLAAVFFYRYTYYQNLTNEMAVNISLLYSTLCKMPDEEIELIVSNLDIPDSVSLFYGDEVVDVERFFSVEIVIDECNGGFRDF
jgi:hypothetical protein